MNRNVNKEGDQLSFQFKGNENESNSGSSTVVVSIDYFEKIKRQAITREILMKTKSF